MFRVSLIWLARINRDFGLRWNVCSLSPYIDSCCLEDFFAEDNPKWLNFLHRKPNRAIQHELSSA